MLVHHVDLKKKPMTKLIVEVCELNPINSRLLRASKPTPPPMERELPTGW